MAVAVAGNGQFLVVWQDRRNGNDDIYGQRLTSTGGLTGGNFVIANSSSAETAPALAWHSGANAYLVVWQSNSNVWARPFSVTGVPLNPAFAVSTTNGITPAAQPAVATIPGASTFLVAWNQSGFDGDNRILARAVMTAEPKDDIFPIAEEPLAARGAPTLAAAGDGTHLLAWEDSRGGHVDVYARLVRQEVVVNTSIEYTYDPLYRLVAAAYSGHITAEYSYTYDEAGNRTGYTAMLTNTVATTYTYNAANQLLTAKASDSPDTWYYAYDGNGNQVRQVPNGLTPAAGETRYTFNQRGRLVRSEQYAGGSYQTQATAGYNDDDQRLRVTLFVGGLPITTTYVVDAARNGLPLAQRGAAGDVSLLYGLFPLGEYGEEWRYYLGDGQFSVRGVVDGAGDLLLARTYDPFGGLLRQAGTGNVLFGFMGAQAGPDGLLYVNGRYFNPATGRFLSPDNGSFDPKRPRTLNGYLAVILFFGMPLSAFFAHKRGRGKYPQVWVLFGLLFLTNLVSCQTPEPPGLPTQPPPVQPPPTGAPDPNPSGCTDGYERPRCPRHAGWNGHKETMQGILNRVAVTVANRTGDPIKNIVYAPETVFLRGKGLIIEGGEAAVPTTQAMYDAMSKKGEQIVGSLQKAITAGSDRADYSCNEIVGLALNLDDFIGLGSWHWSNYTANFIFENVQEPDVVIYGQKYGDNNVFVGHAALIAYLHPTNSELTITVQSDGSATESGIFFIHVQDSRHVLQFTTLFGERRHD